uniref:Uncharacterized protein n=1 Tax=Romanomermis culicivorax TaxID=13658 RepID=A0A915JMT3_ROMCU
MYEQLLHERLWPCIGAIESEEQQSVVQKIMASANAITISIRKHLIMEFRIVCFPTFVKGKCAVYITPPTTYVAGWGEIFISQIPPCNHQQMLEFVGQKVQKFDNLWRALPRWFTNKQPLHLNIVHVAGLLKPIFTIVVLLHQTIPLNLSDQALTKMEQATLCCDVIKNSSGCIIICSFKIQ